MLAGSFEKVERIAVLGLGNILLSDEGLGLRAVEKLKKEYHLPEDVRIVEGGTGGIDLLYDISGLGKLLVLDAVRGGRPPATFYRLREEEVKGYLKMRVSLHELGLQEILSLLDTLGKPVGEVVVLGLEPKNLKPGIGLSPEVEGKLPLLIGEAVKQLREWGVEVRKKEGCGDA